MPLSKKQRIYVGFSYGPFGERVIGAHYKIIPITIIDYERLKKLKNDTKMGNSTVQSNNSATVTITIGSGQVTTSAIPMETKTFEIDTTKSLDYFPSIDEPQKSLKRKLVLFRIVFICVVKIVIEGRVALFFL